MIRSRVFVCVGLVLAVLAGTASGVSAQDDEQVGDNPKVTVPEPDPTLPSPDDEPVTAPSTTVPPIDVPILDGPPPEPEPEPEPGAPTTTVPPPDPAILEAQLRIEAHNAAVAATRFALFETQAPYAAALQDHETAVAARTGAAEQVEVARLQREAARSEVGLAAVDSLVVSTRTSPFDFDPTGGTPEWMERGVMSDTILEDLQARFDHATRVWETAVDEWETSVDVAEVTGETVEGLKSVRDGLTAELAELEGQSGSAPSSRVPAGPTILGDSVLTAAELVAWFKATDYGGWKWTATEPIEHMAIYFIEEGKAEGVRGDIAFVQTLLETGRFSSGHTRNSNFSGIGAYDHCAPTCGWSFPSARAGVRAQVQLLRTYAEPGLTTADLANPPDPRLPPEKSGVRGCCPTWTSLTGVWATDPGYGAKLMKIWNAIMGHALEGRLTGKTPAPVVLDETLIPEAERTPTTPPVTLPEPGDS